MSGSTFWSRRQAAVARESVAEQEAARTAARAEAEAAFAERDDAEILDDLGLPEPEALNSAQAVREFLDSAVPQRLKNRAMRRLWRLNPMLANLDGLVDYGQDFTDSANVIENMQTAYQVGKGMMAHIEALAAEAEAKAEVADHEQDEIPDEAAPEEGVEEVSLAEMPMAERAEIIVSATDLDEGGPAPIEASRRRMTFQFEVEA